MEGVIFDWIGTLYDKKTGLYSYTKDMLNYLAPKYKLGLVSLAKNGIDERRLELEETGILYYFDSVIISTEKAALQYLNCMQQMGTTPNTTSIVDDRTIRGIKIGNELGCITLWIQQGEYAHEIPDKETGEPTYRIDSIKDLSKYL